MKMLTFFPHIFSGINADAYHIMCSGHVCVLTVADSLVDLMPCSDCCT